LPAGPRGIERTSIGIRRRCAAKTVFIKGMYWLAFALLTEMTRIRALKDVGLDELEVSFGIELWANDGFCSDRPTEILFVYVRASVRAPAKDVEYVSLIVDGSVLSIREVRELSRAAFTMANGL